MDLYNAYRLKNL